MEKMSPLLLTILASLFTYGVTALGALSVFLFKKINRKLLDFTLGFSGGVMIAASFWSLISPAIVLSEELGQIKWMLPSIGFLIGGLFILIMAKLIDNKISMDKNNLSYKRCILLVSSVTIHNIPEGLAVGVAFGGVALGISGSTVIGALMLALGIGLQNFPEGMAVALPLRREGASRMKSFLIGQSSGIVEPFSAVFGFLLTTVVRNILPFMLTFAAGAMIAVVVSELLPEGVKENKNITVTGCIIGFLVMMILDVALS